MNKLKLLILTGPPGSGKTHFAEQFSKTHNYIHVNSDQTRAKHFKNLTFSHEERVRVYEKIFEIIENHLKNEKSVLFDGNLVTNKDRFDALKRFEVVSSVLFIFFNTPKKHALERALNRKRTKDRLYKPMHEGRAREMHASFENIDHKLPHIIIDGSESFNNQNDAVLESLNIS